MMSPLQGLAAGRSSFSTNPFTLGVASGDPTPDGVVLWTRLAPQPLAPDGSGGMDPERVRVRWRVATDHRMRRVVSDGVAVADPALAHSVHVEVRRLKPGREYSYQFSVRGEESPIGRTSTAWSYRDSPRRLRFAAASCQHFEQGFYNSYAHMRNEDLDLVLFLGDYIYEDGVSPTLPRQHDGDEPLTLAAYRNRHALYKSDQHLQASHALCPWLVVWDDHEVENNWASPFDQNGTPPADFLPRRAAAFQAYYEHMPLRAISSGGDGADVPANAGVLLSENPHIKFVNTQRGYIVCDVTSRRWRTDYRTVPYVTTEGAPITTRASFVVEAGDPGIQQV